MSWIEIISEQQFANLLTADQESCEDCSLLHLNGQTWLSPQHLQTLTTSFPKLKGLRLSRCTQIGQDRDFLSCLSKLENIEILDLSYTHIFGEDLKHISGLIKLKELYLWGNEKIGADQACLGHLQKLTALETLHLGGINITGKHLQHIASLVHLKQLQLPVNTNIGEDPNSLVQLRPLTSLEFLNLSGTGIMSQHLQTINNLVQLNSLWIADNRRLGDDPNSLSSLSNFGNLRVLKLSSSGLSDVHFENFPTTLFKLTDLDLAQNDELTDDCLNFLAHMSVELKVIATSTNITQEGLDQLTINNRMLILRAQQQQQQVGRDGKKNKQQSQQQHEQQQQQQLPNLERALEKREAALETQQQSNIASKSLAEENAQLKMRVAVLEQLNAALIFENTLLRELREKNNIIVEKDKIIATFQSHNLDEGLAFLIQARSNVTQAPSQSLENMNTNNNNNVKNNNDNDPMTAASLYDDNDD